MTHSIILADSMLNPSEYFNGFIELRSSYPTFEQENHLVFSFPNFKILPGLENV